MSRLEPRKSGWVAFLGYHLRPEYKILGEVDRFQLAAFLVDILESPYDRVEVDCYCSVGFKSDVDFFVRYQSPTPAEIQEICVKVNQSGLGRFLSVTHDWLALHREGPYPPAPAPDETTEPPGYFVVYPLSKEREWFYLSSDEQTRLIEGHQEIVRAHPGVRLHVDYSFGVGEREWVFSYDVGKLEDFEAYTRELQGAEIGKFLHLDGPVLVGRYVSANEALELCGAL